MLGIRPFWRRESEEKATVEVTTRAISNGDNARDNQNWAEAELYYRSALDADESLAHIWMQYGHALKEQGKYTAARAAYQKSIELAGETSDSLLQLAHLLKLIGNHEEARTCYFRSYQLDPSSPHAAQELRALGDFLGVRQVGEQPAIAESINTPQADMSGDAEAAPWRRELSVVEREITDLKNALNDVIWRTERSYLSLAENVAAHSKKLEGARLNTTTDSDRVTSAQLAQTLSEMDGKTNRELVPLREALNDTIWRTERSILELSGHFGRHEHGTAEALSEVEKKIAALSELAAEFRERIAHVAVESQQQVGAMLEQKSREVDATVSNLLSRLEETDSDRVTAAQLAQKLSDMDSKTSRELVPLREALNDTIWRTERSILELSGHFGRHEHGTAEALAEVEKKIAAFSELAVEFRERIAHVAVESQQQVDAMLEQKSREVDATVSNLSSRLEELALNSEQGSTRLGQWIEAIDAAMISTSKQLYQQQESMGQRLEVIGSSLAELRLHADAERAGLQNHLHVVEHSLKDLTSTSDQTRQQQESMGQRLEVFGNSLAELRLHADDERAGLQNHLHVVERSLKDLTSTSDQTRQQQENMGQRLEVFGNSLAELHAQADAERAGLQNHLHAVERSLKDLTEAVASNKSQFDHSLHVAASSLQSLKDLVTAATGRTGERFGAVESAMAEIRQRLEGDNGHVESRLQSIDAVLQALAGNVEAERAAVFERLKEFESAGKEQSNAIEKYRDVASEAEGKIKTLAHQTNQAYGILNDELRPLGLLFPFGGTSSREDIERHRMFMGTLAKQEIDTCWVCGSVERHLWATKDELNISECDGCGLLYPDPRISENELERLYGSQYWNIHQRVHSLAPLRERALYDYHNALARVFLVKPYRTSGRWLDVGCAAGALVQRAQEHGFKSTGLEISPDIVELGKELFGVKIRAGRIETAKFDPRSFDVVTLFDVFEHLYNPDRALRRIHQLLARRGLLLIETFRTDCADFQARGREHPDCKPHEHIGMYREDHIDRVLERNGFNVIDTRYPQGSAGSRIIKFCEKVKRREIRT